MGFALPDLDQETIDELILSIQEALDEVEPALELLASEPDRADVLNDLFRNLHTIKGNFRMCFLDPFTDYVHEVEDTVSEVRKGRLRFSPVLKDALLLGLDKLRDYMERLRSQGEVDTAAMRAWGHNFQQLANSSAEQVDALAQQLFDLNVSGTTPDPANDASGDSLDQDLAFFKSTALKLDQRLPKRAGRTDRLLTLIDALYASNTLGVPRAQLEAAVYLHDIGLGVISSSPNLVIAPRPGEPPEQEKYLNHPMIGSQFLAKYPQWQEAADIIAQHHEYLDGSGYPNALAGEQILPGAQLLGLLSDFCDLQSLHAELGEKRAVLKALFEINADSGKRYNSDFITALTLAIRAIYT